MHIWVDADACPVAVKEVLYKAAKRTRVTATFVANQPLSLPPSPYLRFRQVAPGFDIADNWIVQQCSPGDLVITADIPLAAEVIEKGGHAVNPRGQLYNRENIRQRLAMRDLMESLRDSGQVGGGPAVFGSRDKQAFANTLDRLLAKAAPSAPED